METWRAESVSLVRKYDVDIGIFQIFVVAESVESWHAVDVPFIDSKKVADIKIFQMFFVTENGIWRVVEVSFFLSVDRGRSLYVKVAITPYAHLRAAIVAALFVNGD